MIIKDFLTRNRLRCVEGRRRSKECNEFEFGHTHLDACHHFCETRTHKHSRNRMRAHIRSGRDGVYAPAEFNSAILQFVMLVRLTSCDPLVIPFAQFFTSLAAVPGYHLLREGWTSFFQLRSFIIIIKAAVTECSGCTCHQCNYEIQYWYAPWYQVTLPGYTRS